MQKTIHYSLFTIHSQCRHSSQQGLGVFCLRVVEHRISRAIFHQAAAAHHRNIICQVMHHTQIMRNKYHRDAHILHQISKQVKNLALDGDIQRRNRFICQQQGRTRRNSTGNGNALALAA